MGLDVRKDYGIIVDICDSIVSVSGLPSAFSGEVIHFQSENSEITSWVWNIEENVCKVPILSGSGYTHLIVSILIIVYFFFFALFLVKSSASLDTKQESDNKSGSDEWSILIRIDGSSVLVDWYCDGTLVKSDHDSLRYFSIYLTPPEASSFSFAKHFYLGVHSTTGIRSVFGVPANNRKEIGLWGTGAGLPGYIFVGNTHFYVSSNSSWSSYITSFFSIQYFTLDVLLWVTLGSVTLFTGLVFLAALSDFVWISLFESWYAQDVPDKKISFNAWFKDLVRECRLAERTNDLQNAKWKRLRTWSLSVDELSRFYYQFKKKK